MKKFAQIAPGGRSRDGEFADKLKGLLGGIEGSLKGPGGDASKLQGILISRKTTLSGRFKVHAWPSLKTEMLEA